MRGIGPALLRLQARAEMWLTIGGAVATAAMMAITTAEVVTRKVFNSSLQGSYEYVSLLFPGVVFLGLAYAQARNEHIQIDIFHRLLPAGFARPVLALVLALSLVMFALITWYGAAAALWAYQMGDTILGALPVLTWPSRVFVPVGAGLLCVRLLIQLGRVATGRQVFDERRA